MLQAWPGSLGQTWHLHGGAETRASMSRAGPYLCVPRYIWTSLSTEYLGIDPAQSLTVRNPIRWMASPNFGCRTMTHAPLESRFYRTLQG